MKRRTWIIALVATSGLAAIAIGIVGFRGRTAHPQTDQKLCSGVDSLQSSIVAFDNMDPTSASLADFEAAVSRIRRDWDRVQGGAKDVGDLEVRAVETKWADFARDWKGFEQAVDGVPWGAPVHDILFSPWDSAEFFVLDVTSTYGRGCSTTLTPQQLQQALP